MSEKHEQQTGWMGARVWQTPYEHNSTAASSPAPVAPAEPVSEPLPCPTLADAIKWIRANCSVDTGSGIYMSADRYTTRQIKEAIAKWNQRAK